MKQAFKFLFSSLLALGFLPVSQACTTVFSNTQKPYVVARTVDLFTSDLPILRAEPRGAEHRGEAGENSQVWTSKYGSLVVTAFHSNTVTDGINEKGLVVHLLYLSGTQYPAVEKGRPVISNLAWGRYMLDNFSTVREALEKTKDLQIVATTLHNQTWPIHLTMEDAGGDSAVIEFMQGKMHIYHGAQYRIMTNEPAYDIQLANLKKYQGFGGKLPLPGDPDPLSRFVRVASFLKTMPASSNSLESIANILSVIRTAMVPFGAVDTSGNKTEDAWPTRWVSVADPGHKIYYFNSTSTANILWIDLNKINFSKGAPVLSIDPVNIDLEGDITRQLRPFS